MADSLDVPGFAKKIRAKYPGAYDQLSDQDLAAKVLNLHPQYAAALDASKPEVRQFIGGMNNPSAGDMGKRLAQEGVLGGLTGIGLPETQSPWGLVQQGYTALANKYDTGHPVQDTVNQMLMPFSAAGAVASGVANNMNATTQAIKQDVGNKNYGNATLRAAFGYAPLSAPQVNAGITAMNNKDYPAAMNAGANLGGQALSILAGTPEGAAATDAIVGKVGGMVNKVVPGTPLTFNQLLTKAIRPSIKNVDQLDSAINALEPDLTAAMEGDKQTLDTFQQAVSDMRKSVWKQSQQLKPNASQMVDGQSIHDSIMASISPRTKAIFPDLADAVETRAKNYLVLDKKGNVIGSKQIPINDAEQFLQEAHADLDPYFNKSPFQQATNIRSSADVAATKAEADALRNSIHGQLADPTLRKKYGFLTQLDQQAQRRQAQMSIQALQDLPDRMSKTYAAVRGTQSLLTGNPNAALESAVGLVANSAIKTRNLPDSLINRAFNPSLAGRTVPPGIVGPAVAGGSAAQHLVNWTYDPQSGSLVPVDTPAQLQDQF